MSATSPPMQQVNVEQISCRVCLASVDDLVQLKESGEKNMDVLSPCHCSGNKKWIHRSCLDICMRHEPIDQRAACNRCK